MIHFKSCPRCGGDVDATYTDDVHCVQCSHRLDAASLTAPERAGRRSPDVLGTQEVGAGTYACPRCGSSALISLDRLRLGDNYCYRCRPCGHIFSPAARSTA